MGPELWQTSCSSVAPLLEDITTAGAQTIVGTRTSALVGQLAMAALSSYTWKAALAFLQIHLLAFLLPSWPLVSSPAVFVSKHHIQSIRASWFLGWVLSRGHSHAIGSRRL